MLEIGDFFAQAKVRLFFIGYANYDPDFTKSQPNRTVYIKQHDGNRELFAQVNVRLFLYDMRITTQISQILNRVVRCICCMMEIGNFFAQVKVRLFLIGYANYDPDFTKSQANRTVYKQHDGNRELFRTSQSAAFL